MHKLRHKSMLSCAMVMHNTQKRKKLVQT